MRITDGPRGGDGAGRAWSVVRGDGEGSLPAAVAAAAAAGPRRALDGGCAATGAGRFGVPVRCCLHTSPCLYVPLCSQ